MNPFNLLPLWVKALIVAAIVSAVLGACAWFVHVQRDIGRAEVQARWDAERGRQASAALAEAQNNATETQRRLTAQKEIQDAHDKDLARAQADAARAAAAAGRLRDDLAAFTAAACRSAGDTAAQCDGKTARASIGVLAELFRRADERAGVLAEYAGRARAAGIQCSREYDALTVK